MLTWHLYNVRTFSWFRKPLTVLKTIYFFTSKISLSVYSLLLWFKLIFIQKVFFKATYTINCFNSPVFPFLVSKCRYQQVPCFNILNFLDELTIKFWAILLIFVIVDQEKIYLFYMFVGGYRSRHCEQQIAEKIHTPVLEILP